MFDLRQQKNGRPLLVGHRGAMDVAPENTMVSFEAGLAGGADIIELDVQLTADKQVILFHDDDFMRKWGVAGRIGDYTADYLQTWDAGGWFGEKFAGTPMPLLDEVLAWGKARDVALMIELKHGPVYEPELDRATVALIEDHNMVDEVIITSFDQFALQRVQEMNPNIATSFIYICRLLNPLAVVNGLSLAALSPATNFMTREEVQMIQTAGYACSPGGWWWDYPTLLEWGVDTISSNDPASVIWPER
jgi:glycerophosphoryl diester phosphodiesterase